MFSQHNVWEMTVFPQPQLVLHRPDFSLLFSAAMSRDLTPFLNKGMERRVMISIFIAIIT